MAIRTGIKIDNDHYNILIDIDTPDDTIIKWFDFLRDNGVDDHFKLNTPTQQTGNNGYHYIFKINKLNYDRIRSRTGITYKGIHYNIDVKFNNSCQFVEPSNYQDINGNTKYYKWLKSPADININILPEFLLNFIISNESKKAEKKETTTENNTDNLEHLTYDSDIQINEHDSETYQYKLLCLANFNRFNTYQGWLNIGRLLKFPPCFTDPLTIWIELSKKSEFFNLDGLLKKWQSFKNSKFTDATLHYYAKNDNHNKYYDIIKLYNLDHIYDADINVETDEIEQRYLINKGQLKESYDKLRPKGAAKYIIQDIETPVLCNKIINFFSDHSYKSFNIKSPYDTGKTTLLKEIISLYDPKRILWLSYRKTLTFDIHANFKRFGFKSYLDREYDADKLILQVESLQTLENVLNAFEDDPTVPKYDLIILDEIESLLNQFSSEKNIWRQKRRKL